MGIGEFRIDYAVGAFTRIPDETVRRIAAHAKAIDPTLRQLALAVLAGDDAAHAMVDRFLEAVARPDSPPPCPTCGRDNIELCESCERDVVSNHSYRCESRVWAGRCPECLDLALSLGPFWRYRCKSCRD